MFSGGDGWALAAVLSSAAGLVTALSCAYVRISRIHLEWWKAKHLPPTIWPSDDSAESGEEDDLEADEAEAALREAIELEIRRRRAS